MCFHHEYSFLPTTFVLSVGFVGLNLIFLPLPTSAVSMPSGSAMVELGSSCPTLSSLFSSRCWTAFSSSLLSGLFSSALVLKEKICYETPFQHVNVCLQMVPMNHYCDWMQTAVVLPQITDTPVLSKHHQVIKIFVLQFHFQILSLHFHCFIHLFHTLKSAQ